MISGRIIINRQAILSTLAFDFAHDSEVDQLASSSFNLCLWFPAKWTKWLHLLLLSGYEVLFSFIMRRRYSWWEVSTYREFISFKNKASGTAFVGGQIPTKYRQCFFFCRICTRVHIIVLEEKSLELTWVPPIWNVLSQVLVFHHHCKGIFHRR